MKHILFALLLLCSTVAFSRAQAVTSMDLIVERNASLTEQILFESDLKHLPQVTAVIPLRLNVRHREYRLVVTDVSQTGWLGHWLEQHGYQARETEYGWQAY